MKDSFLTILAVLFIGLKLAGVITWSWVWVLSPLWIPWLVLLIIFTVVYTHKNLTGGDR